MGETRSALWRKGVFFCVYGWHWVLITLTRRSCWWTRTDHFTLISRHGGGCSPVFMFGIDGPLPDQEVLKLKLSQLVNENKQFHTELKTTVMHEIKRPGQRVYLWHDLLLVWQGGTGSAEGEATRAGEWEQAILYWAQDLSHAWNQETWSTCLPVTWSAPCLTRRNRQCWGWSYQSWWMRTSNFILSSRPQSCLKSGDLVNVFTFDITHSQEWYTHTHKNDHIRTLKIL